MKVKILFYEFKVIDPIPSLNVGKLRFIPSLIKYWLEMKRCVLPGTDAEELGIS